MTNPMKNHYERPSAVVLEFEMGTRILETSGEDMTNKDLGDATILFLTDEN